MNNTFSELLDRVTQTRANKIKEVESLAKESEKQSLCLRHQVLLKLDPWLSDVQDGRLLPKYEQCSGCAEEERVARYGFEKLKTLKRLGIPAKLVNATLEELVYSSPQDQHSFELCRKFAKEPNGFLILLGGAGCGKTHIAAAILISCREGRFITHNEALRELRKSYGQNYDNDDPIDDLKTARFLVLDEIGVSTGGRDDFAMLHEIIDYRCNNFLPTVITSNLGLEEFKELLGERVIDRLREGSFATLQFSEASHRKQANDSYLEASAQYHRTQKRFSKK